jgi:hypothetical protein
MSMEDAKVCVVAGVGPVAPMLAPSGLRLVHVADAVELREGRLVVTANVNLASSRPATTAYCEMLSERGRSSLTRAEYASLVATPESFDLLLDMTSQDGRPHHRNSRRIVQHDGRRHRCRSS